MLDIKKLRDDPGAIEARLKSRGSEADLSHFKTIDESRRALLVEAEGLKEKRNKVSTEIGRLKKSGGDADALVEEMGEVSATIKTLDASIASCEGEFRDILFSGCRTCRTSRSR